MVGYGENMELECGSCSETILWKACNEWLSWYFLIMNKTKVWWFFGCKLTDHVMTHHAIRFRYVYSFCLAVFEGYFLDLAVESFTR